MRQIERIQNKIEGIWHYTELELSDYSTIENLNTCTVCQTEVCDTCLDDMAEKLK